MNTLAHAQARRLRLAHPALWLGAGSLALIGLVALLAGFVSSPDPMAMVARPYLWPGADPAHWLGTDMMGRDIWSGLAHGARVSLSVGLQAGLAASVLGVAAGCLAGYFGGRIDNAIMRLAELFQIMPALIFTIVIVAILSPTAQSIALGIAATSWPNVARLARGETLKLREADFVQAATVMGMGHLRIVATHVVPNALSPVVALLSLLTGQAILTEAALAFLGLGDPNAMSWGSMIGSGREVLRTAWYMTALPGAAIFLTVLALNLLGSGLNDLVNARRGSLS